MGDPLSASPSAVSERLDLRDLAVFVEVAESGSFRGAAVRLFRSQPSVSRAVARLESGLGVRVLERGPRGAMPTAAGRTLLDGARRLLAAADTLRVEVTAPDRRCVRIGATATSARTVLAPFLPTWLADHPELAVSAVEDTESDLVARLHAGECDVALLAGRIDLRSVEAWRLARVGLVAVMPHGHRLAGGVADPLPVVSLAGEPLLLNGPKFPATALLLDELGMSGRRPRPVYESGVGQTLASMAETGLGVAVFGDTTDLRGFDLAVRPVAGHDGRRLGYDLHLAWLRGSSEPWKRELALALTAATRRTEGAAQ